ncbi:MAG: hypothetical protein JXI33_02230 [Candidatus Aminicenantes bacterium]|nr:hypothetical protein [Candidatus Aminicenantes bacterium]
MTLCARVLILCSVCIAGLDAAEIYGILPASTAVTPWALSGQPQTAHGEDLYLLINGGAELVIEYGFQQAMLAEYGHPDGGRVNIEIYEMDDSESAYGLYSLKKGRLSTPWPVGQEGALDDYYLNVWKGSFVITLTGLDQRNETRAGLKLLAAAVSAKIPSSGVLPGLLEKLVPLFVEKPSIALIKGPLGASNRSSFPVYPFLAPATGVILKFPDGEMMIVECSAAKSEDEIHKNLSAAVARRKDLSWQTNRDSSMILQDRSGKLFSMIFKPPIFYFSSGETALKKLDIIRRALEGSN